MNKLLTLRNLAQSRYTELLTYNPNTTRKALIEYFCKNKMDILDDDTYEDYKAKHLAKKAKKDTKKKNV